MPSSEDYYIRAKSKLRQINEAVNEVRLGFLDNNTAPEIQEWLTEYKNKTRRFNIEMQLQVMDLLVHEIISLLEQGINRLVIQKHLENMYNGFTQFYELSRVKKGEELAHICQVVEKEIFPMVKNHMGKIRTGLQDDALYNRIKLFLMPPFEKIITRAYKRPMGAIDETYMVLLRRLIKMFPHAEESWQIAVQGKKTRLPIIPVEFLMNPPLGWDEYLDPDEEGRPLDANFISSRTARSQFLRTISFMGLDFVEDGQERLITLDPDYIDLYRTNGYLTSIEQRDEYSPEVQFNPPSERLFLSIYFSNVIENKEYVYFDLAFWFAFVFATIAYLGILNVYLDTEKNKLYSFLIHPFIIGRFIGELTLVCAFHLGDYDWGSRASRMLAEHTDKISTEYVERLAPFLRFITVKERFLNVTDLEEREKAADKDDYFDKWVKGELK